MGEYNWRLAMKLFPFLLCGLCGLAAAQDVLIANGLLSCDEETCRVSCDYGFIPSGPYAVPLVESSLVSCEVPVGLVVGGYNRAYGSEDTFLASAEKGDVWRLGWRVCSGV